MTNRDPFAFLDPVEAEALRNPPVAGESAWVAPDSNFDAYADQLVFPGFGTLHEIVQGAPTRHRDAAGIDIAAGRNGRAMQQLMRTGVVRRGVYTTLHDQRTVTVEGLDHATGDLRVRSTWQKIIEWRRQNAPEGFSVVLHRPVGDLQELPPSVYFGATHWLLDRLRVGGIFFTQVPDKIVRENWCDIEPLRHRRARASQIIEHIGVSYCVFQKVA